MKLFIPSICPLCSRILHPQTEHYGVLDCRNPAGDCFWAGMVEKKTKNAESFVSAVFRRNPRVLFIFYEDRFQISFDYGKKYTVPYGNIDQIDFASKESLQKVFAYGEKLLLL